jgi:C4-dicarboxylate-specific signal transduction histidine kinase
VGIETGLSPELPLVNGDHVQLQQVLLNLIVNGCDAMQERPPEERCLTIETTRESEGVVRISVIDRGAGVPADLLQRIFEPFYSTKSNGLGMGLSICQAIVKAHGGRLWATNNADRGAAFHFTLKESLVARR